MSGFAVMTVPLFEPMSIMREPSMETLFCSPRMPLTLYRAFALAPSPNPMLSRAVLSGATTPGRMRSSSSELRLMIDRFSIWLAVMVFSRDPVSVWSWFCSAVTVTVSLACPTSRLMSRGRVLLVSTLTADCSAVLNPPDSTLTV